MVKTEFKATCRVYGVKPKALKECLKKENIKVKYATKRDVLNTIFVYAPDLMFTRSVGDGMVEYLNKDMPRKLINEMTITNKLSNENSKEIKNDLTIFEKYQIVNEWSLDGGMGSIFEPETAHKNYGVDFFILTFRVDYDVVTSCTIGGAGIKSGLSMHFTDDGIAKLLQNNSKMIDAVEEHYQEYIEELQEENSTKDRTFSRTVSSASFGSAK